MASYGKILSRIWKDQEFVALNPQQQQLYMLLLSHPKRNHAGVLSLTLRQWASVTAEATESTVRAALMRLAQTRFVVLDWGSEEVLIRTYIRNDGVWQQPNLMKSALKQAQDTQSAMLQKVIAEEIQRLETYLDNPEWQKTAEALLEYASSQLERHSDAIPHDLSDGMPPPYGVGGNVSAEEDPPFILHRTPTPTHTARAGRTPAVFVDDDTFDLATSERNSGLSRPVAVSVAHLVDDLVPRGRARGPERSRLILMAADVERVYGLDIVAMALRKWVETSKGAQILMSVASDVNAEGFHSQYSPNNGRPLATHDKKFNETQAMKDPGAPRVTPQELFSRQKELR